MLYLVSDFYVHGIFLFLKHLSLNFTIETIEELTVCQVRADCL